MTMYMKIEQIIAKVKDGATSRYRVLDEKYHHKVEVAQQTAQNAAVIGWKGLHRLLYGNPLESVERVQKFLRHPVENLRGIVTRAEIQALSELWELSYDAPTYPEPRKVYPIKRGD